MSPPDPRRVIVGSVNPVANARFETVDALRGLAVVWMTVFHLAYDLNHFRFIQQSFLTDPFWTTQRTVIVSLFLATAGCGQAIAVAQGQGWRRFGRRWVQVAGCAALVSVGSWLMFPRTYIHFGVLHALAVLLVLARLTAGWGNWLWPLGAVAMAMPLVATGLHTMLGNGVSGSMLDGRALNWLGLVSRKPVTEDWVPVLPWLGVLWWGMAAGRWLLAGRPQWLAAPLPPCARPLVVLGRWSLSWYMVHQPVMIGALMGLVALR